MALFDFDESFEKFNWLNSSRWGDIQWTNDDWLYRVRSDYVNIRSLVLPVPAHRANYASRIIWWKSLFEVELYFSDDCLRTRRNLLSKPLPWWNTINVFGWNKKTFWKKLVDLDIVDFASFVSLFSKIEDLLA